MRETQFGIIGCGLMGMEFASAAARWRHLPDVQVLPRVVAICDTGFPAREDRVQWFRDMLPSIRLVTADYRVVLADPAVEAVYVAVPHHLHQEIYCAAIEARKHLMGEKPFGVDSAANAAILDAVARHPEVLVRCASQFPFFPALQRIGALMESGHLGRIIELHSGFLHSSDLDPLKPVNWKRQVRFNGEYGCLGDLGMHACHVPFRAGFKPLNVRAILSRIFERRPDGKGNLIPCETWDNAALLIEAEDSGNGNRFPWILRTHRIAPGEKNTWYLEILGTNASVRFSTKQPNTLQVFEGNGSNPGWVQIELGHGTAFRSITGGIFEFGFSDAILQMWAAFLYELAAGRPLKKYAGCVLPQETRLSHALFTAALESQRTGNAVKVA